jgi:hypothetical protein
MGVEGWKKLSLNFLHIRRTAAAVRIPPLALPKQA